MIEFLVYGTAYSLCSTSDPQQIVVKPSIASNLIHDFIALWKTFYTWTLWFSCISTNLVNIFAVVIVINFVRLQQLLVIIW